MGQLAGDALGSQVEFMRAEEIARRFPDGIADMAPSKVWNTIPGQPTDDSEMALLLARMLIRERSYDRDAARREYQWWLNSNPFDCGRTIQKGLSGSPDHASEANGALMRISPLGIFGANHPMDRVAEWARQDAAITHPHAVCQQANALLATAISTAIRATPTAQELYDDICTSAAEMGIDPSLQSRIDVAVSQPPHDYFANQGWVLVAFHNALYQLLHAPGPREGIMDTVMRGGDTDTNAAICGALMGTVYGLDAFPENWVSTITQCRPENGRPDVHQPRPECLWPVDALELARGLVGKE